MKLAGKSLFSIATALIVALIPLTGKAENTVENPGFEVWEKHKKPERVKSELVDDMVPAKWGVESTAFKKDSVVKEQCFMDKEVFHSGETSVKLVNPNSKTLFRVNRFASNPIEAGKYYKISCWVKGENLKSNPKNRNSGVVMQFIPGSKKGYWSDKYYANKVVNLNGDFDWQQISCIYPIRANGEVAGFGAGLWYATGTLWIDDFSLEETTKEAYLEQEKANVTSKYKASVWREQYGPASRQQFSLYLPKTDKPAPVLVQIHGGGWLGGNGLKDADMGRQDGTIRNMNARGIAVAVINYRFSPLPTPVYDAARAIQFLRYNAEKYNLDKTKFAATGFSAGATTSLWLALHDDLADPDNEDPVLRESTRLMGAYVLGVQSTIDPVTLREWGLEKAMSHSMICKAAGFKSNKDMDANYESKKDVYKEFSPVTHLDKNDPPIYISARTPLSSTRDWIHHPRFGYEFKKQADKVGAICEIQLSKEDSNLVEPPTDSNGLYFLMRLLTK